MKCKVNGSAGRLRAVLGVVLTLLTVPAWALEPKQSGDALDALEFFLPDLYVSTENVMLEDVLETLPNREAWEQLLSERGQSGGGPVDVFIDRRSGVAAGVVGPFPLIPGDGAFNTLTLADLGALLGHTVDEVTSADVAEAAWHFVDRHHVVLGVDMAQLGAVRVVQVDDRLWHVSVPQQVDGIKVRDARLVLTVNHGNVVVFGTQMWSAVSLSTTPMLDAEKALEVGFAYAGGRLLRDGVTQAPQLELVPTSPQGDVLRGEAYVGPVGQGYRHRLVWGFSFQRPPESANWELLIDAHTGELVAFQDKNRYLSQQIKGGVYPLTSTGICPTPGQCGTMALGWPMPWANTGLAAPNDFTNGGGVYNFTSGIATTTLNGKFIRVSDACGILSASSATGAVDLGGTSGDHDCVTPGLGGAGNTAASRSGFYELNKLAEQARGWLPSNTWLQGQVTANMNLNSTCNAFYSPASGTVNFYRSGAGCRNTGEIAAVFDHEWGHGLDDFDSGGVLSNSSEAYADIAAIYRLQTSCVGHGFWWTNNQGCGMTSDGTGFNGNESPTGLHCDLDCSGVRDADWNRHADHLPDTALGFVCSDCTYGSGPCGRQTHCAAAPVRQAAWDLVARDLVGPPFSLDSQTAFLIGNKLFYQGSGVIGQWHACTCGSVSNGCGATNGYMQWLAADDDNGNVNDGTPHMTAVFNAYDRHGIACPTPSPMNSGCAGGPSSAPTLTAAPGPHQAALSWSGVSGAARYWVLRTEGHAGCDFGKVKLAEVTTTSYTDTQVAAGRSYSYNVVAQGTSSACSTRVSNCVTLTPTTPTSEPDFSVSVSPEAVSVIQGGSATATVTATSMRGFAGVLTWSASGLPTGATFSFAPNPVTLPPDSSAGSTLTLTVSAWTTAGTYPLTVSGVSGGVTRTVTLRLTVSLAGSQAAFDPVLRAPKCALVTNQCDTGPTLVRGRDTITYGPESNQPNTINGTCADGTAGAFQVDESNDRLRVTSADGTRFAPGKTVIVEATVWAWPGGPSSDHLDLYYAANAHSPNWTYVTTLTPSGAGVQVLTATYVLPPGTLQAVRANFRYAGTTSSCSAGPYDDRDDLIFAVGSDTPVTLTFTSIAAGDGYTWESSESSSVGGGANSSDALRVGDTGVNRQYRSIVSFNTAAIPDTATITAASLTLVRSGVTGTNPFDTHGTCQVDIVTGAFGGAAQLTASDFEAQATVKAVGSLSNPTADASSSTANLNPAGLAAINKAGLTQLKFYFTLDDDNDGVYDYVAFHSGNKFLPWGRPTLTVKYLP